MDDPGDEDPQKLDEALADIMAKLETRLATDDELERFEREEDAERRRQLLIDSGVAEVLSKHGLEAIVRDQCEPTRALQLVRPWLAGWLPVVAVLGETDAGKTVAAGWALARVPGLYIEANDLARHRRAAFGGPDSTFERAVRTQLLVVDELGAEDDAEAAAAALHEVINRRQRGRRTLLLGNIDAKTFVSRYDARTISRLREVGKLFRVRSEGLRTRVGGARA